MKDNNPTPRRGFLGTLIGGAAAFGLSSFVSSLKSEAAEPVLTDAVPAEQLFKNLKGKHKFVFDTSAFKGGATLGWTETFLNTNNETGTPDEELNVVIILRSLAVGMSLNDKMWEKYKLGELYKIDDPATKAPALRNLFTNVKKEELIEPAMSIDVLQKRGVLICICSKALKGNSEHIAEKLSLKGEDVLNDLLANLIPDAHVVPSGVWALGRAQERGCAYSYAGA